MRLATDDGRTFVANARLLFVHPETREVYILVGGLEPLFATYSVDTGMPWTTECETPDEATDGLEPFPRGSQHSKFVEAVFYDPNGGGKHKRIVLAAGEPYSMQLIDDELCERIAKRWGVTPERAEKALSAWRRALFSPEPNGITAPPRASCGCFDPQVGGHVAAGVCGNCGNPFNV